MRVWLLLLAFLVVPSSAWASGAVVPAIHVVRASTLEPTVLTPVLIALTTDVYVNGVDHAANDSKLYVTRAGTYFIEFSANVNEGMAALCTVDMWLRVNGTDINYSSARVTVSAVGVFVPVARSVLVPLNVGDYVQAVMSVSVTGKACGIHNFIKAGESTAPAVRISMYQAEGLSMPLEVALTGLWVLSFLGGILTARL